MDHGGALHTTTSGVPEALTGVRDSRTLNQNGGFSFTFSEVERFAYFCTIHPSSMRPTITVTADGASSGRSGDAAVVSSYGGGLYDY